MKKIMIPNWQCEFCGEVFNNKSLCEIHELEKHKCPTCEHAYYVYGCELNCDLINNHKNCKFKQKENNDEKN